MREYEKVVVEDYEVKSVTCNKCGKTKELHGATQIEKLIILEEFQSFDVIFGYGSKFDEENWKFDICEECIEEFVNTFKIKPEGYGE